MNLRDEFDNLTTTNFLLKFFFLNIYCVNNHFYFAILMNNSGKADIKSFVRFSDSRSYWYCSKKSQLSFLPSSYLSTIYCKPTLMRWPKLSVSQILKQRNLGVSYVLYKQDILLTLTKNLIKGNNNIIKLFSYLHFTRNLVQYFYPVFSSIPKVNDLPVPELYLFLTWIYIFYFVC